jgi:nitrogen fixation protein FixH
MKILLVIVAIIGLGAIAGSIIVGKQVFDGKVTDRPYETGLAWDRMQKERSAFKVIIQTRDLRTGRNKIIFSIMKNGSPFADDRIFVAISRPSTTAHDRIYDAVKIKDGLYRAEVELPLYGHWNVGISLDKSGSRVVSDDRVFVEKKP